MPQYLAIDYPQSSMNQKMIKRHITLHYSINWQNPAPIQRVWPLLMCVLMIPCMCARAYKNTHTPCNISNNAKEQCGRKKQDSVLSDKLNGYAWLKVVKYTNICIRYHIMRSRQL